MEPTLSFVQDLARGAGQVLRAGFNIRPGFGEKRRVTYKGDINPVTEVDARADDYIIGEIRKRFPDHQIVSEESGTLEGELYSWIIDPLDGTVNFAHGLPGFCVSIGYVVNGEPEIGVVYDPVMDECFSAVKGQGAWLNGEPIRASKLEQLDRALLVTDFSYDIRTHPVNNFDLFQIFTLKAQSVRWLGVAALDLCYAAAGRIDGYWVLDLEPWDVAAGLIIAREAGLVVTRLDGSVEMLAPPVSVLAANPALYLHMADIIKEAGHPKR
jgi:myo-inositol-1(or 4)-monophosphatase